MRSVRLVMLASMPLLLASCNRGDVRTADSTKAKSARDSASAPRVVPYEPTHSQPAPARAPAKAAPSAAHSPAALPRVVDSIGDPQAIVRDYYAAIRAHDFMRAYKMWQASGQTGGRSYAQFEAGFDSTETVDAGVGAAGRLEGTAGSRFATVPVEISARLRNGTAQRFTGTYTLRRVDVAGASPAQRHWHLYAANIRQVR